jgi:phage shock protein PspC (stress-responsive transcriptional regulator)
VALIALILMPPLTLAAYLLAVLIMPPRRELKRWLD